MRLLLQLIAKSFWHEEIMSNTLVRHEIIPVRPDGSVEMILWRC
jgi:hypothetical protein